jgi:hypothetical protein
MSGPPSGAMGEGPLPGWPLRRILRLLALVVLYGAIVLGGTYAGDWIVNLLGMRLTPTSEPTVHLVIMLSLAAYVVLMALPFVPGVEVGLALIFMLGAEIVPVVYLGTVLALVIAFAVGRLVPERLLAAGFAALGRAARLVERLQPLAVEARVAALAAASPAGIATLLVRRRHWAIALLLNVPGNGLIGGGGGIAMAVGMSRLVSLPGFLVTIALGTAPVPVAVLVMEALR